MPTYTLPIVDGTTTVVNPNPHRKYHQLGVASDGAGTLTVTARATGSTLFESVPDGAFDLAAPISSQFFGSVDAYSFTLSGVAGPTYIHVTDSDALA